MRNEMAEMVGPAMVTTFADHHIEPTGGERGKLFQRLMNEGQVRIDLRRACSLPDVGTPAWANTLATVS